MQSIVRRAAVAAAVIFALPFGLVACEEADAEPKPGPSVIMAQTSGKQTIQSIRKARGVAACNEKRKGLAPVPARDMLACAKLGAQPVHVVHFEDGSSYTTAEGPARVTECRSQFRGAELHECLNQPLKG